MAGTGVTRARLQTACGDASSEAMDAAVSDLLLAGHIYMDNNAYVIV